MAIIFKEEDHSYTSIDLQEQIDWLSVTTIGGAFKTPFDAKAQSVKSSKKKNAKWSDIPAEVIQEIWKKEAKRSTDLGTFYHNQREHDILEFSEMERHGVVVPVFAPKYNEFGHKIAPEQRLINGIYPEHMVHLKSAGICGQSDLVEVVNDTVYITDYKTNKEIKRESYRNWEGIYQMMTGPLSHLQDCHLMHYAVQLSIYMYIILKHNPRLKPGQMFLHHVTFEIEGTDEYGYPIAKLNEQGDPIVKGVEQIEVPYLKDEVISILHWLIDNRDKVKKK